MLFVNKIIFEFYNLYCLKICSLFLQFIQFKKDIECFIHNNNVCQWHVYCLKYFVNSSSVVRYVNKITEFESIKASLTMVIARIYSI